MKKYLKQIISSVIFIVMLFLDMLTKYIFDNKNIILIKNVLNFSSSHNTGAGFSILSDKTLLLTILSIVFLVIFTVFNLTNKNTKSYIYYVSLSLIYAGAIGNLIDRLIFKYVRDFIYFELINFPIFNVADICLTVGVILLAIYFLFFNKPKKEKVDAI